MRQLSHTDTLQLQSVLELGGDLLLLPQEEARPYEEARALQVAGILPVGESLIYEQAWDVVGYQERYNTERFNARGVEPSWVHTLPMALQKKLRVWYASTKEDVLAIVNELPHTGIRYSVRDDQLCEKTCRAFGLWRLQAIKQLGFLQSPWVMNMPNFRESLSDSTRYLHSLDVMALATLIGTNARLSKSALNTLRLAALTHDMGTPAGGDSVKIVDLKALDEDANYEELIDTCDWASIQKEYRIDRTALLRAVRSNDGILGNILDVADKLAYVARDIKACMHHIEAGAAGEDQLGLRTLKKLIERHQYVCGVWDALRVRNDTLYCNDAARLIAFLKVRVLLFRELYYHPYSRFGEFLISRLLVKAMYQRGALTKAQLLKMDDSQLLRVMSEEYSYEGSFGNPISDTVSSGLSRCESFARRADAEAFIAKLQKEGNVFTLLEDTTRLIKTGAKMLVKKGQSILPIFEAYPGDARELDEMARMLPQVHVYYLEGDPPLSRESLARLKKELEP